MVRLMSPLMVDRRYSGVKRVRGDDSGLGRTVVYQEGGMRASFNASRQTSAVPSPVIATTEL